MQPLPEHVHWMFGAGFLFLALCLAAEALVGRDVWRRCAWRAYLWPGLVFAAGLLMWPVMVLYTSSMIHMLAHGVWAHALMLAGALQLAAVRGRAREHMAELATGLAVLVSGVSFLFHEQNGWLFSRSAFLHHAIGWTLIAGSTFVFARARRPRSPTLQAGFALTMLALAVLLFSHRDVAPIFGHLSELARSPRP